MEKWKAEGKSHKDVAFDLLEDIGTSNWMKKAILDLTDRDVVDVLNELDVLKELFWLKYKELTRNDSK